MMLLIMLKLLLIIPPVHWKGGGEVGDPKTCGVAWCAPPAMVSYGGYVGKAKGPDD